MLDEKTVKHLSTLTFDPEATRNWCILPLGGIYWSDEIPDFKALIQLPEVGRLFDIRFQVWRGIVLSTDDQQFWDGVKSQFPKCPIILRDQLSVDDQTAQADVEREALAFFEALADGSDQT